MTKERSFPWTIAIPLAIIASGVIVTICNAFPYVHIVPGGLYKPGGYPDSPPYNQASAGDGDANLWQSFLAGGFTSVGGVAVILGAIPVILGVIKLLARHKRVVSRFLTTMLFLVALIGLLFTWLLGTFYFNDSNDLVTFLPAGLWALWSYVAILLISIVPTVRNPTKVHEE